MTGRFSKTWVLVCALAAAVAWPATAQAEVVTLIDNTRIYGKLIHYFDGELTIQTTGGARVKLPTSKIKSLRFKLQKPKRAYSTPAKTFNIWKQSLIGGKLGRHVACYALMYQMMMTNMMGAMSRTDLDRMVAGHKRTRYSIRGTRFKGRKMAFLKVVARLPGKKPQEGELLFVKENGEWKMVPPQFQRPPQQPGGR